MARTELEQFITCCRNSPITVEFLEANQTKYDYVKESIDKLIYTNPKLTIQVFQWLLFKYPDSIKDIRYDFSSLMSNDYPMEKFII
jgi:hypothetical protein